MSADLREVPDRDLERAAYILGDTSAAAMALSDLRARREAGQDACAYLTAGMYLIGPRFGAPSSSGKPG